MLAVSSQELISQLNMGDEAQRQQAAYLLGISGDRTAVPLLLAVLRRERSPHVLWAAAAALGELGDRRAREALTSLLLNEKAPFYARYQASVALQRIAGIPTPSLEIWRETSAAESLTRPDVVYPEPAPQIEITPEIELTLADLREIDEETIEAAPNINLVSPTSIPSDEQSGTAAVDILPGLEDETKPDISRRRFSTPFAHLTRQLGSLWRWRGTRLVEERLEQYQLEFSTTMVSYTRPAVSRRDHILPSWILDELENAIKNARPETQKALRQLLEATASVDLAQASERQTIEQMFTALLRRSDLPLSQNQRQRLFDAIIAEILGLGPLELLFADDLIYEIMINGPRHIFFSKKGWTHKAEIVFEDEDHLMRILDRILAPLGQRIHENQPIMDVRMPDNSRLNIVMPPVALNGPVVTIRRSSLRPLEISDLIRFGAMSREIADFLRACVIARVNILISGNTGSGKTTLTNILAGFVPNDERIVTVEHEAEFRLSQEHVVNLETQHNPNGREITYEQLVANAALMRPDRIIFGEFRSGRDALSALQAVTSGYDGTLMLIHANDPRDAIVRLEMLCRLANSPLPEHILRELIAGALDVIVHQERLRDGQRKVIHITEVRGLRDGLIDLAHIFEFETIGYENGRIIGRMQPKRIRPEFMSRIEDAGIHIPPAMFGFGARQD